MLGKGKIFENSKPFENEAQNSKNPNFDSSVFIIQDIDSKISHLTSPYRWPQFVRQHFCSISYSFAARWRKLVHFAVFYRKFVSQQPEVVESHVIAHFDGFLVANTIKLKHFESRSKVKNKVKYSKITFSY